MKILYDHQIFCFQEYGGISRIFYELAKRINKTKHEVIVEGKYSNNFFLRKIKKNVNEVLPKINFTKKNILIFYLNRFFGEKKVTGGKYDILHATYYHPYFIEKLKGKPYVITVFDMIHEVLNKDYKTLQNKTIEFKRRTVLSANKIIAISKNTKKDIIKIYKTPSERIQVIYLGNPLEDVVPKKVKNLPNKYVLFVGNRLGYKNFDFFVKSIVDIIRLNKDVYLVCGGGGDFTKAEKELFSEMGVDKKVIYKSFSKDEELAGLYSQAMVYVIPSLYEGFGLTILEAFSMNCPVVASKISSIPEVGGNAVYYIDPKNNKSIENAIRRLLNDKKLREDLVKKGQKQLKKFSWEKCIRETLDVYKKVLTEKV